MAIGRPGNERPIRQPMARTLCPRSSPDGDSQCEPAHPEPSRNRTTRDPQSSGLDLGICATGVSAFYGEAQALFDVSIHARKAEITAILGHNGAGKTTLLRCLAGLHNEYTGTVMLSGSTTGHLRPHQVAKRRVYLVREGGQVFDLMTVQEHLDLATRRGAKSSARAVRSLAGAEGVYEAIPLLAKFRSHQAGLLSGGQRQALSLGMALAFEPQVLLIDEPSTGLAPSVAESIYQIIADIAHDGRTLLVAEQEPQWLINIASIRYIMDIGRVVDAIPASR